MFIKNVEGTIYVTQTVFNEYLSLSIYMYGVRHLVKTFVSLNSKIH